jgi:Bacterial transcriptional activator domain
VIINGERGRRPSIPAATPSSLSAVGLARDPDAHRERTQLPVGRGAAADLDRVDGHLVLIEVLAARGNVAEALLAYESLRRRLRDDLEIAPGDELQALHAELLGAGG